MLKGILKVSFTIGRPIVKFIFRMPFSILLPNLKENLPNIANNQLALLFNIYSLKPYFIAQP